MTPARAGGVLIGIDWGASRMRAFLFDEAGVVRERRDQAQSLLATPAGGFERVLGVMTRVWRDDRAARFILCGMVGSRQGWAEAPYARCPADGAALAARLLRLDTALGPVTIAPGVAFETAWRADVMRGEETQILGAAPEGWSGVAVTPGTHSKWTTLEVGKITGFRTWMTGELFAVLKDHSILGRLMAPAADDSAAYALGVQRALADPAITSLLFSVRAEVLLGRMTAASLASYLSGLLIGAEVLGGLAALDRETPILIVGAPALTSLYAEALVLAGRRGAVEIEGGAAAARGLWRLDQLAAGAA